MLTDAPQTYQNVMLKALCHMFRTLNHEKISISWKRLNSRLNMFQGYDMYT